MRISSRYTVQVYYGAHEGTLISGASLSGSYNTFEEAGLALRDAEERAVAYVTEKGGTPSRYFIEQSVTVSTQFPDTLSNYSK